MTEYTKEELRLQVEHRREELILEEGDDSEMDELRINEILRDEFSGEIYDNVLVELGINIEETGLEEIEDDDNVLGDSNLDDKDKLTNILLNPENHLYGLEKRFKGYAIEGNKFIKKKPFIIPSDEIDAIMAILRSLYTPQSLASNLKTSIKKFENSMNKKVNNARNRLNDDPDHIVDRKEMRIAIDILLTEILTISNAISSGRLGNLSRDIIIGSYNEKEETDNSKTKSKLDELKAMG